MLAPKRIRGIREIRVRLLFLNHIVLHMDFTDLTDFPFKMGVSLFYGLCYYMAI